MDDVLKIMNESLFHCHFGVVARSAGQSTLKLSAYIRCATGQGRYGERYNFTRKSGELLHSQMMVPEGAPSWANDPEIVFKEVEAAENRIDAMTGREIEIAIPRQIPRELYPDFAKAMFQDFPDNGIPVLYAVHETASLDGLTNPHLHGLLATRSLNKDGFSKKKTRGLYSYLAKTRAVSFVKISNNV